MNTLEEFFTIRDFEIEEIIKKTKPSLSKRKVLAHNLIVRNAITFQREDIVSMSVTHRTFLGEDIDSISI
jgi:hypothetical protein